MRKEYRFKYFSLLLFTINLTIGMFVPAGIILILQQAIGRELLYNMSDLAVWCYVILLFSIVLMTSHSTGIGILHKEKVEIHANKKIYILDYKDIIGVFTIPAALSSYGGVEGKNGSAEIYLPVFFGGQSFRDFLYALKDKVKEETGNEIADGIRI